METVFVPDHIGERLVLSLPVSNRFGGTSLVTVVLDELLWKHQFVVVNGVVRRLKCYGALIRDKKHIRLVGTDRFNVHAYEETFDDAEGKPIKGWVLMSQ